VSCVLSVVVPVFGEEAAVEECVAALAAARARLGEESELVLVLNRVSDGLRARLRAGDATLVEPAENLGFAPAVNAAIAVSAGEFVALVNDDCVVEPDALRELVAVARGGERVGSVAAQLRFARRPELLNSAGLELDELGVAAERLLGEPVGRSEAEPVEVFGASGAFALYRRALLDELGGFDGSFFAYLEDVDVAWRARMLGWRCLYAPRAVGFHDHSRSFRHGSAEKDFLVGRNRVRLLAKNATSAQLRRRGAGIVAYELAFVCFSAVRGRTLAPLRGRLRGLREWRRYRALGTARRPVALAPPAGLRAALNRNRVYASP
jgi:GT2 family glycosyltransferase